MHYHGSGKGEAKGVLPWHGENIFLATFCAAFVLMA